MGLIEEAVLQLFVVQHCVVTVVEPDETDPAVHGFEHVQTIVVEPLVVVVVVFFKNKINKTIFNKIYFVYLNY